MRVDDIVYEADSPLNEETAQALAINEVLREPLSDYLNTQRTRLHYVFGVGAATVILGIAVFAASVGAAVTSVLVVVGLATAGGSYVFRETLLNRLDFQRDRIHYALGGGVVAVVLIIVASAVSIGAAVGCGLIVVGLATAGGGYEYITSQSPDITVTAVEKGYWTGHCLPMRGGTMVYDATHTIDTTTFELERLADETAVSEAMAQLESTDEFPVVMSRNENVEEALKDALADVRATIESAERHTVEAPLVSTDSPDADAIKTFAARADDVAVDADSDVSVDEARDELEQLDELKEMASSDEVETDLQELSGASWRLASDLSGFQETAVDLLNNHIGTAADAFGLVSYRFYCPTCQMDDIDSVVELSDPQAGEWYCETCRSTHDTAEVVPRHRIKDDLVNPIWDQLWVEKDDQRRKIYEDIEDQKDNLREKEFEQRQEEIRTTTDRIRDLRARIRDLKTDAQAAEGKVSEIGDLMVKYERLNKERKESFEQEVENAFGEIDAKTERILNETRNQEQKRIEEAEQAAKDKAQVMREEKRRREVGKFLAAQEREDARVQAQLEQQAALHGEEMELEKRQHREDWMLETRGRTSFSSRIDQARMKKDRLLGASSRDHRGGN